MKRANYWNSLIAAASLAGLVLSLSTPCSAQVIDLSGRVSLLDGASPEGVKIRLGVDLNRDGKFSKFEELRASVKANGSFRLSYTPLLQGLDLEFVTFVSEFLAKFQSGGFDAIMEEGPLQILVTVDRKGYSTVTHRMTTASAIPKLEVLLDNLDEVICDSSGCLSSDGTVRLGALDPKLGVLQAFARARDPQLDLAFFPGEFADSENNLLISSGFTEIDLRDENGVKITQVEEPVSVRFKAEPQSWAQLRDLEEESGIIEVPMYSFNEQTGEWVAEADGELQDANGSQIPESDFPAIQSGDYGGEVYIAFATKHFSTFNCDAPIQERACIKGRILVDGAPLTDQQVRFEGVNYTGTAGGFFTGPNGEFASDVMKSELKGEDVDRNRKFGESFLVRPVVHASQYFRGAELPTPTKNGTVGSTRRCVAAKCDCTDLGDIELEDDSPRACKVRVQINASGSSLGEEQGPLARGDILGGVTVTGTNPELLANGRLSLPNELCSEYDCGSTQSNEQGFATFYVPATVDGSIQLRAQGSLIAKDGFGGADSRGVLHRYSGSILIEGCAEGEEEVASTITILADYVDSIDLDEQHRVWQEQQDARNSASSGSGSSSGSASRGSDTNRRPRSGSGCACDFGPGQSRNIAWFLPLAAIPWLRRRRASGRRVFTKI